MSGFSSGDYDRQIAWQLTSSFQIILLWIWGLIRKTDRLPWSADLTTDRTKNEKDTQEHSQWLNKIYHSAVWRKRSLIKCLLINYFILKHQKKLSPAKFLKKWQNCCNCTVLSHRLFLPYSLNMCIRVCVCGVCPLLPWQWMPFPSWQWYWLPGVASGGRYPGHHWADKYWSMCVQMCVFERERERCYWWSIPTWRNVAPCVVTAEHVCLGIIACVFSN